MKKSIMFFLATIMIFSLLCVPVAALDSGVQPRYQYIDSITTSFDIDSNNKSDCYARAVTYSSSNKMVLTMELQYYSSGTWKAMDTWVSPQTAGTVYLYKTPYVPSGYSYRLRVNVMVYDSNGNFIESQTKYSVTRP